MTTPESSPTANATGRGVASIFFCLVGIYIVTASLSMTRIAAVFPRTIGAVMVALSLLQIAAALTGRSGKPGNRR